MAVFAVGFSFPQAFAHLTTSLNRNVQHILAAIATLQLDLDIMQSDIEAIDTTVDDIIW